MRHVLIDYLEKFEFCDEAKKSLLRDFDKMLEDKKTIELITYRVNEYKENRLDWDAIGLDIKESARTSGISEYTVGLLFYIQLVPYSYHFFEEKGLGYTEWYDSMIDLRWKAEECYKVYGIWGVFTDWFKYFFTADRIAFGRLQFNLVDAERNFSGSGFDVKKGDTLVTVHIPSDTRTPFSKENREKSYARAVKYYARLLGKNEIIFRCATWLLLPAHREILPESSNVRSFLDDFVLFPDSFKETDGNIWRLFYTKDYNGDPNTLPEDTSMMRAYKKFMLGGGKIGTIVGLRREIL